MRYLIVLLFFVSTQGFSQSYIDFYFKSNDINGAIVILNDQKNEWIFNSESEAFSNSPAASHYHLWQTLVGLEHKVFSTNEKAIFKWDGVKRSFFEERKTEWNVDMNLAQALKQQNDVFFNQLKDRLSADLYKATIENTEFLKDIKNSEVPYFWNFTGLTNPNTMILFLKSLYEKKLAFNKGSQDFLISQLSLDQKLIVHTSSTSYNGKKIDWTIGIYKNNIKPIYFSYRTQRSLDEEVTESYFKRRDKVLVEIFQVLGY